jgi:hypothetical protein
MFKTVRFDDHQQDYIILVTLKLSSGFQLMDFQYNLSESYLFNLKHALIYSNMINHETSPREKYYMLKNCNFYAK